MNKETTYDAYQQRVIKAQNEGFSKDEIIAELKLETYQIRTRLALKLVELAGNASPYPAREAKRIAEECIRTIERICDELKKEMSV